MPEHRDHPFDLPFQLWKADFGRIGDKSVVSFQIRIDTVHGGITDIGFDHPCLEVTEHDGNRDPFKQMEGPGMSVNLGANVHKKDKANEPAVTVR